MGTPLTNDNSFDGLTALGTRLAGLLINVEIVLEISTTINPINAGSVMIDAGLQGFTDGFQEKSGLACCYAIGEGKGMETCAKQGLVSINIPKPREEALVHQKGFQLPFMFSQPSKELLFCKRWVEWLGT